MNDDDVAAYIICHGGHGYGIPACGSLPLTKDQYLFQMDKPWLGWCCPTCGGYAEFDDHRSEELWESNDKNRGLIYDVPN